MKASTLHQPWASLVAVGLKPLETRTRRTGVRGDILITAAKRQDLRTEQAILDWLWDMRPDDMEDRGLPLQALDLPRGVALGVVRLVDCRPLTWGDMGAFGGALLPDPDDVIIFGDTIPDLPCFGVEGRHAWVMADPRPLDEPVPVRGMQGWPNIAGPWDR